jgi:acyl-CoA thioesterase YciA
MTDTPAAQAAPNADTEPSGDLCIRTLAMPADTNANGDIFGGWLLGQMDVGGGVFASKVAKSRTVTVAIEAMSFRKAVYVGDLVSVYGKLVRIGRTSVTVRLEAWAMRRKGNAVDPGDRRQFHLRLDRRSGSPAGDQTGWGAHFDLTVILRSRASCAASRRMATRAPAAILRGSPKRASTSG